MGRIKNIKSLTLWGFGYNKILLLGVNFGTLHTQKKIIKLEILKIFPYPPQNQYPLNVLFCIKLNMYLLSGQCELSNVFA